jgi:hypothetical protein
LGSGPLGSRARGSERAFRQRVHFDQLVEHVAGLLPAPAFLASFDAFRDSGAHLVSADETARSQPFGDVDSIDQRDVTVGPPGLESVDDGGGREAWLGLGRTLEAEGPRVRRSRWRCLQPSRMPRAQGYNRRGQTEIADLPNLTPRRCLRRCVRHRLRLHGDSIAGGRSSRRVSRRR